MDASIKAQWLQALRSGEYQQAHGQLRNGNSMCCLGVLCDIAAKHGMGEWRADGAFETSNDWQRLTPPDDIRQWAGLDYRNPKVGPNYNQGFENFQYTIADFNDGADDGPENEGLRPHTFTEIADLIEQYL